MTTIRTAESPQVESFKARLVRQSSEHLAEVLALQLYLEEHRHGAALDDVRWGIAQSTTRVPGVALGHLRVTRPELPPYRVLFAIDDAETWIYYLVGGDKSAGHDDPNQWYAAWVPVADAYLQRFLDQRTA